MLIGFVCLHVLMVLKLGINEWPMPGRLVRRATYERDYHELTKNDGAPFVPYAVWKDMFFAAFILLAVGGMRAVLRPVRADRPARSDDHPDRAEARLLLPVALCAALAAAAVARNAGAPHRTGRRDRRAAPAAVSLRRRREELEAAADRGVDRDADRDHARHVHASRGATRRGART